MDKNQIKLQIIETEMFMLEGLRKGEIVAGLEMHLNSPDYRNVSNGEILNHEAHQTRAKGLEEAGINSYDLEVINRDFLIINETNVIETLFGTVSVHKNDGSSFPPTGTVFTFLWQRVDQKWKLGYLHSSKSPIGY